MYPLVESIKVLNGYAHNLQYHQERIDRSFAEYFKVKSDFQLHKVITIPQEYATGLIKLRFLYSKKDYQLEFSAYKPPDVQSLIMVESTLNYQFKFTERSELDSLLLKRGDFDDILIIRNEFITDTSIANIVFHNNSGWFTPSTPLLKGTCRQKLLDEGRIQEVVIKCGDLNAFDGFCLINAMHNGELLPIPIEQISRGKNGLI